jgi:hypothetical protein
VSLNSASFAHRYEGTYNNPNLTGTNTSFTEFPGEVLGVWAPSSDGDILSFRNTIASGGGYFDNNEWDTTVSDAVGWTIEFRVKIGTDFDDDPLFGAFQVFAKEDGSTATTRRVNLWIGQDFTTLGSLNSTPINTSNNTDGFHVFRIAQPASSRNVTIWRDGVSIYSGSSRGSNNTGLDMYFGDGSSGAGGPTCQVDYFRWDSTGPYEPVPVVPGDFNGDGNVDGADFVAWQTTFPKAANATLAEGDADGDGDVDGADFVVWQTNFPFGPASVAAPVPEPSAVILAIFGGLIAWRCRNSFAVTK